VNSIVLDASAILAIVNREPGHEKLTPQLLSRAIASTVNVAEAHTKLVKGGWNSDEAWNDAAGFIKETVVFDEEHARLTGNLSVQTHTFGLSLGDRLVWHWASSFRHRSIQLKGYGRTFS